MDRIKTWRRKVKLETFPKKPSLKEKTHCQILGGWYQCWVVICFFEKLWGSIPSYHYLLKELLSKVLNFISKIQNLRLRLNLFYSY
jgi:hypothetical protein